MAHSAASCSHLRNPFATFYFLLVHRGNGSRYEYRGDGGRVFRRPEFHECWLLKDNGFGALLSAMVPGGGVAVQYVTAATPHAAMYRTEYSSWKLKITPRPFLGKESARELCAGLASAGPGTA